MARKRRENNFNIQEYERMTKHSSLGTLHAIDFSGNEQPLCELTALDKDILIGRLCDLEDLIEDGMLVPLKLIEPTIKGE